MYPPWNTIALHGFKETAINLVSAASRFEAFDLGQLAIQ